jgi:hypothetical protein
MIDAAVLWHEGPGTKRTSRPDFALLGRMCAHSFLMGTYLHHLADKRAIGSRLFEISDNPRENSY